MYYREVSQINFPSPQDLNINMMPIVFGDQGQSLPQNVKCYLPLIEKANFDKGDIVYLTIHESFVLEGTTQRRSGIHTDGTKSVGWGGSPWGMGQAHQELIDGIYMASSDGDCHIWNVGTFDVDELGSLIDDRTIKDKTPIKAKENTLYWLTDRTPHQSLPATTGHYRQFFRLVSNKIGLWFEKHNTPNPLGVLPNCPISNEDKFVRYQETKTYEDYILG